MSTRSDPVLIPMWIPEGHDAVLYGTRVAADQPQLVMPYHVEAAQAALAIGAVYEERDA